jgi:hypothetical protein
MLEKHNIYYNKKTNIFNFLGNNFFFFFKNLINKIKTFFIFTSLYIVLISNIQNNIKIALCTMGKKENLYVKEFINYYFKLGIDKIFIIDDNDKNTEQISDMIDSKFKHFVKIYKSKKLKLFNQSKQFTFCYTKNKIKFDWILMVDMDEYLYIKNDKLKNYLLKPVFKKCDFIKIHRVIANDNNHLHYENMPLFERFKGPYKKDIFIKSIIKGNIPNLKYQVHSPYFSPIKNISCNNESKIINIIIFRLI